MKKIKKFRNLLVKINISTNSREFLAICKEFSSNFPSLRIGEEGWKSFKKFLDRDKEQIPIIQRFLKKESCPPQRWDGKIIVRKDSCISSDEIQELKEILIVPYSSRDDESRILKIISAKGGKSDFWMMINYSRRPSLEHKDGYVRLCKKLEKNLPRSSWVELNLIEEEISEEDEEIYLSRGLKV